MRLYAVYPISAHGEPMNPVFICRSKTQANWYLDYLHKNWEWQKPEDFYVVEVQLKNNLKLGVRRKKGELLLTPYRKPKAKTTLNLGGVKIIINDRTSA